jgi:hypothetical protein
MKGGTHPDEAGDLLYPAPTGLRALEAVRGSILILDWRWLRSRNLMASYERALDDRMLLEATATDWMSFPAATAHWRALDSLSLPPSEMEDVGRFVGKHVHSAFLTTLIRLAGELGVSPWSALRQCHKLWTRSWRGGGVVVRRVSPTAARIDVVSSGAIVPSRFFRASFRGAVADGIAQLCTRAHVVELEDERTSSAFALRASWV